jgi:N-acetyl-alpha-D-glucosaminyl L-malate synthase BshA
MHEVVRTHRLDLLHVHYAIPHATSAWIAREMLEDGGSGVRIATTLHGTDITLVGQDPSFHAITKFSIERSDALTAVSEYLRRETYNAFGCTACAVEVIHNFINPDVYDRRKHATTIRDQVPAGRKVLMHISNFRPVKRVEDVVDIFARIRQSVRARLVLVGDGPERPRALEHAEELGVRDDVLFLGKHASVDELLACADVFLLPSSSESFGLAALEAMACGAPVVATRTGGLPEVVEHGVSGYLLPVGAVDEMAAVAVRILTDEAHHAELARAGRQVAEQRFSARSVVPLYESYYEQVLAPVYAT